MNAEETFLNVQLPTRVWVEIHAGDLDARDVIVEMEDGMIYTALFVTLTYLNRQMELTRDLCRQVPYTVPMRFAALDVPHVIVDSLSREHIEDMIDNLLAMDTFETIFTQVTDRPEEAELTSTSNGNGRRATQEVAAVVLSDVLVVED